MAFAPFVSAISLAVLAFLTLLLVSDRKRPGAGYLISLLAIMAIVVTMRLAFEVGSVLMIYLPFVGFPVGLMYGPLIFFYTEAVLLGRKPAALKILFVSILPVCAFVSHAYMHLRYAEMRVPEMVLAQQGVVALYSRIFVAVAVLSNVIYVLYAWRNLRRYVTAYHENFAGNDRDQTGWLRVFLLFNFVLLGCFFAGIVVIALWDLKIPSTPFEGIVALMMIYVILYYFVKKPQIFSLIASNASDSPTRTAGEKYQKQNLSDSERKAYLEKIEKYLSEEKPFLDDKVTLATLARELGIPAHHFSMVINIERNMNFYHLINFYRVEEAKLLLRDASLRHENVLDIALMAGFQSKAGFNRIFKEITGHTPSAYRADARSELFPK